MVSLTIDTSFRMYQDTPEKKDQMFALKNVQTHTELPQIRLEELNFPECLRPA